MMVQEHEGGSAEILERAWRAEAVHFAAAVRGEPDSERDPGDALQECADHFVCSLALATMGAATRYASEHPDHGDAHIRYLVSEAALVVASVPSRLHRLWAVHFVEGHSLAVYAEATGIGASAAQADYFELIRRVDRLAHARHAEDLEASGIRRRSARGAADPTGAALGQE